MKVAILTSKSQWFVPYARELAENLKCPLYFSHKDFIQSYEIVFILSYHSIIPKEFLDNNKHNLVIHASPLPKGKGWSPMFWQVLEGKSEITFSLFEADCGIDSGDIYLQDILRLKGGELYNELRELQARMCQKMCLEFLDKYPKLESKKQVGEESFYKKRTKDDSRLDIKKSIEEQFNLLRIVSNEEFPAFFYKDGKKFIIKIYDSSVGGLEDSL